MHVLDEAAATVVRSVCETIVPGCGRVGPEVYIDAVLARMPPEDRSVALGAFTALADGVAGHVGTPEFMLARALACEAFYSDFVAPGASGPGAWSEIDFAPPLAARLAKDWSYLGVQA